MKFTGTILLSALVAIVPVLAQASSSSQTTLATSTTTSLTPAQTCLAKCALGDVKCQANCIVVPSPDGAMANRTTECAAKCVQGNGSAAETEKYSNCVQGCISSFFYTTTGAPAGATGTNAAGATTTGTGGAAQATGSGTATQTGSGTSTGTATGAAASASKSGSANNLHAGGAMVGAAGLFAAVLAL